MSTATTTKKTASRRRNTKRSTATTKKATKGTKAAAKTPRKKAEKKPPTKDELTAMEAELREKYSKKPYNQTIVEGSIADIGAATSVNGRKVPQAFREWNKRTVEIVCQWEGCNETTRIATSDLHQVKFCPEHTAEHRKEQRRLRRQAKAAEAKAKAK